MALHSGKFRLKSKLCFIAFLCQYILAAPTCRSYPTSTWQLETIGSTASILATVKVQNVSRSPSGLSSVRGTVLGRAEVVVIRTFPPSAMRRGEHIRLDYEALADGNLGMSGPSVPHLQPGSILIVPLKPNSKPAIDAWRLIADEGDEIVIPAIELDPAFPNQPKNGTEYLLEEVAWGLSRGTREDVLRESSYLASQTTSRFSPEMLGLLTTVVADDAQRWALVTASLVSSLGIPRPTIADFTAGKYGVTPTKWPGSLQEAFVQRLGQFSAGKQELIRQFLNISDLNEWGVGGRFAGIRSGIQSCTGT